MVATIYTESTGRFGRIVTAPDNQILQQCDPGEFYCVGRWDGEKHHVVAGVGVERPPQSTSASGQTLSGFPAGSVLSLKGVDYPLASVPSVTTNMTISGEYPITVKCWPYLDWKGVLHVD